MNLEVIVNSVSRAYTYLQAYSYTNSFRLDKIPVGLTRLYTPETIPDTGNAAPGDYSIRITVTPSGSASPANDGDWGEGNFTIPENTVQRLTGEWFTCVSGLPAAQRLLSKLGQGGKILAFIVDKTNQNGTVVIQTGQTSNLLLDLTPAGDCFRFLQDFAHVIVEPAKAG